MNVFGAIGRMFVGVGKGILAALRFAEKRGLTNELVDFAISYVAHAQMKFSTNDERRDWVVAQLHKNQHVPESVGRLAVELAVQAYKKQVGR